MDTREVVDVLVAAFRAASTTTLAVGRAPDELAVLTYLREQFIAAGARRVSELVSPRRWIQVGLTFSDESQRRTFQADGSLRTWVEGLLTEGTLEAFFFMNKPPGMRVRFCLSKPEPAFESALLELLEAARSGRRVEAHEFGLYDEETHQFGGPAGIDIFHRFSTFDSLAVLRFRELEAQGRTAVDGTLLSLLAVTDLVRAVAQDSWEEWDAWCEMRLTGRLPEAGTDADESWRESFEENRELLEAVLFHRADVLAELEPEERALVEMYERGNRDVARELADACGARALSYPPRKLLPFIIIFHWNRMAFSIQQQMGISAFVKRMLDPKYPPK